MNRQKLPFLTKRREKPIASVQMRHIDLEKILSTEAKVLAAERINVFYDQDRKYKRHADGLYLIKKIVEPLAMTQKLRELSPVQKESMERVIMESYKVKSPQIKQ